MSTVAAPVVQHIEISILRDLNIPSNIPLHPSNVGIRLASPVGEWIEVREMIVASFTEISALQSIIPKSSYKT